MRAVAATGTVLSLAGLIILTVTDIQACSSPTGPASEPWLAWCTGPALTGATWLLLVPAGIVACVPALLPRRSTLAVIGVLWAGAWIAATAWLNRDPLGIIDASAGWSVHVRGDARAFFPLMVLPGLIWLMGAVPVKPLRPRTGWRG